MEEKANVEGTQGGRRGYGGGYLELKEGVKEDGKRRKEHKRSVKNRGFNLKLS